MHDASSDIANLGRCREYFMVKIFRHASQYPTVSIPWRDLSQAFLHVLNYCWMKGERAKRIAHESA